ncbi:ParB/RepB/Spo0J family partition protein [Subtercola frigoramans]|uniref:ParB family chromosome partitioning protein n=1 Tax=Subtercola frigoramans TaxID=120298 RepID=A0ABS2L0E1_9MICO|nr:ParB N-terminal domain-containing protein [Subtercola frigoramans]MBM7470542.1 ParB family chromosome partitioning protein [Subtercola frigoramans]
MTKNNTTPAADNSTAAPDLAASLAAGTVTIESVDPQKVELDPNIRTNPVLPPEFVDSIRAEGVREPVLARRGEDGITYVYDGQRRLLAAREAWLSSMLAVFGIADTTGTASGRILDQLRTFARTELTLTDRIAAYEQLALDGISVDKIAKSAGADKATVTGALSIGQSKAATQYAGYGTVSFDRLLLIAEFDGNEDAIAAITDCDDEDLNYAAQECRDETARQTRQTEVVTVLEAEGLTVVTKWDYSTMAHLSRLTNAAEDADERPALDAVAHRGCEGHAVFVTVNGLGEDDTEVVPLCTKPELHQPIYRGYRQQATAPVELSEEEADAQAETKRAERRTLIANNKAWDTSETVRKGWITEFLTRKKLPADAAAFVAVTLTRHSYDVTGDNSGGAAVFLGHEGYAAREALAVMVEATPTKAGYVSLAVALSARENRTSRESWRNPNPSDEAYLLQIEKWGYHLSVVERIAAGCPEAEADADATAEDAETDTE